MKTSIRTLNLFLIVLFCFCVSHNKMQAGHPIYILLTHPRATGTAFEKVMHTQSDLIVLHAPFLPPYIIAKYGPDNTMSQQFPNPYETFDDVKDRLFKMAEQSPVFFKESGYILKKYLQGHPKFYQNPQVKLAFLVRDPAKSIISFYLKMPTVDASIVGHKDLWEIYDMVKNDLPYAPPIIDSDELLKNPLSVLNQLGQKWDLSFGENNLQWESRYADDWHLKEWYVEVGASIKLETYRGDVPRLDDGTPTFVEVADEAARERLQSLYKIHNPYYQMLLKEALRG